MSYLYGHQSEEIRGLQKALAALNLYTDKIDGRFGDKTKDAVIEAQHLYGIEPADGVVRADLLLDLGITAPKPRLTPNPVVQAIGDFAFRLLLNRLTKGLIPMDGTKPWYTSQTVWASALAILGTVLSFFHVTFGAADQAAVVQAVIEIATAASSLWAIIGRLRATKAIG